MKDHLYFPNNLKNILDYIINCKICLQQKVTVFKENMNL